MLVWGEIRCSAHPPAQLKTVSPKSPVSCMSRVECLCSKAFFIFHGCESSFFFFFFHWERLWTTTQPAMPKHARKHADVHKHAQICDSGARQIKRMCVYSHWKGLKAFSGCLSGRFGKKSFMCLFIFFLLACTLLHLYYLVIKWSSTLVLPPSLQNSSWLSEWGSIFLLPGVHVLLSLPAVEMVGEVGSHCRLHTGWNGHANRSFVLHKNDTCGVTRIRKSLCCIIHSTSVFAKGSKFVLFWMTITSRGKNSIKQSQLLMNRIKRECWYPGVNKWQEKC